MASTRTSARTVQRSLSELGGLGGVEFSASRAPRYGDRPGTQCVQRVSDRTDHVLVAVGRPMIFDRDSEVPSRAGRSCASAPVASGEVSSASSSSTPRSRGRLTALDDKDRRGVTGRAVVAVIAALQCEHRPRRSKGPASSSPARSRGADSPIAARRSRTLQVPATSWTLTSRHPPAIPSAAEASEASRRSPISSPRRTQEGLVRGGQEQRIAERGKPCRALQQQ